MDDEDRLTRIFRMQAGLQRNLGYHFGTMDPAGLIEYIRWNVLALDDELHEALGETYWKPWAKISPGFKDPERYLGEIADALHHLVNLCLAGGMSADDLMAAFEKKNKRNHQRQEEGYTGTDKCDGPGCNRAMDEPDFVSFTRVWKTGERFCSPECEEKLRNENDGQRV